MDEEEDEGLASRLVRYRRIVETHHSEAFQLLRYVATDGTDVLCWNSRDGEAPTEFSHNGQHYKFRRGLETRASVIPRRARLVIVSYSRERWLAWAKITWEVNCRDPAYKDRHPTLECFLRNARFEHGLSTVISREQFLAETDEWQGRLEVDHE